MKPEWKDAPEWARYLAKDKDGLWSWFSDRPILKETIEGWYRTEGCKQMASKVDTTYWRESLEEGINKITTDTDITDTSMNVVVDLWYIIPEKYRWFSRDVIGECYVWSHKPIFNEAEGYWYPMKESEEVNSDSYIEFIEVTELLNVKFPHINLEERPK